MLYVEVNLKQVKLDLQFLLASRSESGGSRGVLLCSVFKCWKLDMWLSLAARGVLLCSVYD